MVALFAQIAFWLAQQDGSEIDAYLRVFNSAGLLTVIAWAVSIERRLARIEGRLASVCLFRCEYKREVENDGGS